ncbi:MAG TPA: prepilin peptidase [Nocardioides sp.]|nr:prepilin peptidase [Nocardioides sp.]
MHLVPALVGALAGLLGGLLVPRLIALCPDPTPDPDEDPADFPDHVPFRDLAARPRLAAGSAVAGVVAGAAIGGAVGWGWSLPWLLYLVPVAIALAVIDFVTWYLPSRLILPSYAVVAALEVVAAVGLRDPRVLLWGAIGFAALGGYYGLMWLVSPRAMAFGDVRLGALLGLALGPLGPGTLLLSAIGAAVLAVVGLLPMWQRGTMIRRKVPFGPFLVGGALLAVVVGQVLAGV